MINGNVIISVLYLGKNDDYEKYIYTLPLNQIVEVNGLDEDCGVDVKFDVNAAEIKPRTDAHGDARSICAVIKLVITVIANKIQKTDVITDAYSISHDLEIKRSNVEFEKKVMGICEKYTIKETVDMAESEITEIVDLWALTSFSSAKIENTEIVCMGEIACQILAKNKNGEYIYLEKPVNFEHKIKTSDGNKLWNCDISADIAGIDYTFGTNGVDIRCELAFSGNVYEKQEYGIITEIKADSANQKTKTEVPALVVYYADPGETVWDIARNSHFVYYLTNHFDCPYWRISRHFCGLGRQWS